MIVFISGKSRQGFASDIYTNDTYCFDAQLFFFFGQNVDSSCNNEEVKIKLRYKSH